MLQDRPNTLQFQDLVKSSPRQLPFLGLFRSANPNPGTGSSLQIAASVTLSQNETTVTTTVGQRALLMMAWDLVSSSVARVLRVFYTPLKVRQTCPIDGT